MFFAFKIVQISYGVKTALVARQISDNDRTGYFDSNCVKVIHLFDKTQVKNLTYMSNLCKNLK